MPVSQLFGFVAVLSLASETADGVMLTEKPDHVTEGVVVLDAPPHDIYLLVTDYDHWAQVFGDVERVRVERGDRHDARVRFRSRAIGYTVTVQFDNIPDHLIRFTGIDGPPGGRAHGEYRLEAIDGGTRTRVVADIYMDIVGVAGWLVSDSAIRSKRRAKVQSDLTDMVRRYDGVARR